MTTTGFPGLATSAYLQQLRDEGERLAASAAVLDLDTAVPACPALDDPGPAAAHRLRAPLGGQIHRRAAHPGTAAAGRGGHPASGHPRRGLLDWFRAGHAALVQTLDAAGPGLDCWTFLPGAVSPLAFWARRQAHETTMHRVDVQLAAAAAAPPGHLDPIPAELAADGVDELLMGFARRNAKRGPLADPPRSLFVQAD